MPRLANSLPKYCKHKASGQAVVTLCGKDFYLGPHGTKVSRAEYDRLVSEWMQNGRRLPTEPGSDLTVVEVCNAYRKHANAYYVKNGKTTREAYIIQEMIRLVVPLYGRKLATEFGPIALKTVRQQTIDADRFGLFSKTHLWTTRAATLRSSACCCRAQIDDSMGASSIVCDALPPNGRPSARA